MSLECDEIKYSFRFKIKNFNICKQELWSKSFNTGYNIKWMLYMNPNKYVKDGQQYVSVYLNLVASYRKDVTAKFKIGLIDNTNQFKHVRSIDTHQFQVDTDWGWATFLNKSSILNKDNNLIHSHDNALVIFCEIVINTDAEDCKEIMDPTFVKQFMDISNDKQFTDLKVLVKNKEYMVHKVVLSSRSPVFAEMISKADRDKQDYLKIEDTEEDTFEEVIKFIYTGKTLDYMTDETESLLLAAIRFEIGQLKRICEEIIYQNVSNESVINVLLLAHDNNAFQLKDKLIKYIASNHPFVKRAAPQQWEEFIEEQPNLVMEIFDALSLMQFSKF